MNEHQECTNCIELRRQAATLKRQLAQLDLSRGSGNTRRVLLGVIIEREKQDKEWGPDRIQTFYEWLPILTEEVGEVARVMNEKESNERLRDELVHVAAVAVAWMEAIDQRGRKVRTCSTKHEQ